MVSFVLPKRALLERLPLVDDSPLVEEILLERFGTPTVKRRVEE